MKIRRLLLACPPALLVFLGGGAGGLARYSLTLLYPASSLAWEGVSLPAGTGAYCRYRLDSLAQGCWPGPLPWGLLIVNLTGSLALGLLTGAANRLAPEEGQQLTPILGTGLLGGYTTFSSAILASLQEKSWLCRLFIWLIQPLLALGTALLGLWVWS